MSQDERPLTLRQLRLMVSIREKGRKAAEVAARSGEDPAGVYVKLGRLVGRGLVARAGSRPPTYTLTEKGLRWLIASEEWLGATNGGEKCCTD